MKIHQYSMLCAPITAQVAAIEALENGDAEVARMRESYFRRRNETVGRINRAGLHCFEPGGAFYVFPDIRPTGLSSKEFATRLLDAKGVAVVPSDAFGEAGEGFVRCCYATAPNQLDKALDAIADFTSDLV